MYWEYEITDREFDELMLFISEKKKDGVKVAMNCPNDERKNYDIVINSLQDFWDMKDEIRSWLSQNRSEIYKARILDLYQNNEWKY